MVVKAKLQVRHLLHSWAAPDHLIAAGHVRPSLGVHPVSRK